MLMGWSFAFVIGVVSPVLGFIAGALILVLSGLYVFARLSPSAPPALRSAVERVRPFGIRLTLIAACIGTGAPLGAWRGVVQRRAAAERERIAEEAHAKECTNARAAAPGARTPVGKRAVAEELEKCNEADWASTLKREADQQEAEEARIAKENKAKADWPSVLKRLDAAITAGDKLVESGKLLDADDLFAQEQQRLSAFTGTSVTSDMDFVAAQGRLETKQKEIAARVAPLRKARLEAEERERKKQEAAEQAATELAELRGPMPFVSEWDGSVLAVERYLKPMLKDPDSFEMANCTRPIVSGAYWVTSCAYRARNSFGALVLEGGVYYIQAGGTGGMGVVVKAESL